ncbi:MAG: hypothetical protein DMF62_13370 [Acidobacteria bacterium]|nr:MAG: hypothetical protein DMF62_13370 [Acidobacteriota bacterium]
MQEVRTIGYRLSSAHVFSVAFVLACAIAAALIGSFPLQLSVVTVFLFAGPHNVMEFRYFTSRMPVRWGRSRTFYLAAIAGVLPLTAAYLTLYFSSGNWLWSLESLQTFTAVWNTSFILWVGTLFYLRGQQRRKDWSIAIPIVFLLASLAWVVPQYWSLALVYVHPFIAMWFLERQIRRTKPEWLRAYHYCLASIPFFLVILWASLYGKSNLSQETNLFWRINQHAGSEILQNISSHLLVATHVFLESIHYFVWLLLIPLVDKRAIPWKLNDVPLFSNINGIPKIFVAFLTASVLITVVLWFGFAADYTTTRDIYFAFAIGHVLAEFPFLIKML